MAQAVHHRHTEEMSPHTVFWAAGLCLAAVALAAFLIAYSGNDMLVANSMLLPLLW